MRVTDESIARVPRMESNVLAERYWDTLQQKCRELLEFIRDDEPGTEALAYYYTLDMQELAKYKGSQGALQISPKRFDVPHIAIHNHPDGNTFSMKDFLPFIDNPNMEIMCAVGHNGIVYVLERLPTFEAASAIKAYFDADTNAPDPLSDMIQYIRYVERFYSSLNQYGFVYRKG